MKDRPRRRGKGVALGILLVALLAGLLLAFARRAVLLESVAGLAPDEASLAMTRLTGETLGLLTLLPALAAVVLAFLTGEVVSSLFASLLYGHMLLGAVGLPSTGAIGYLVSTLSGVLHSILDTVTDYESAAVIILCIVLGGLITLVNKAGAFQSLAVKLVKRIKSPKAACIVAEAMGMCIFFDDYANTLITGPVMRPITDKLRISREKLACIVDSTAAPIASIAVISSWVATQVAAISSGLQLAGVDESAYSVFLASIPFNFYNILAILFVFVNSVSGREYGPMLKAEMRARSGQPLRPGSNIEDAEPDVDPEKRSPVWIGVVPIAALCVLSFIGFYVSGRTTAIEEGLLTGGESFSLGTLLVAFGSADAVFVILEASIVACLLALIFGIATKSFRFTAGLVAWQEGASGLLPTVIILVLAWSLSDVIAQLGAVYFMVEFITASIPYWLVPSIIFLLCCVISFGIGSYGCIAVMVPMVIPIAYGVIGTTPTIADPWRFVSVCTACVLSGSVFGDHCSPITDTTILSSLGAGCDNIDHVKTQLPYALTIAAIATVAGTLPAGMGLPLWVSYPVALVFIISVFLLVGKKPDTLLASGKTIIKQKSEDLTYAAKT